MSYWIVSDELYHHGIKGQKWGIRRYQNEDGTLTEEGKKRYGTVENFNKAQKRKKIAIGVGAGVGGTLAVGAAVVLGHKFLENRKIIESHNEAIKDLNIDIQNDKEVIAHYINKLDEAEKDLANKDKIKAQADKQKAMADNMLRNIGSATPNGKTFYNGVEGPYKVDNSVHNYYKNDPTTTNSRNAISKQIYEQNRLANKAKRAYDNLQEAEMRRLNASAYIKEQTEKLRTDRRDKADYQDAVNYFKSHPFRSKYPKTKLTRAEMEEQGIKTVEPDYFEPDIVYPGQSEWRRKNLR